jgi:hypothetical protein
MISIPRVRKSVASMLGKARTDVFSGLQRSAHKRHQGKREMARRQKQLEKGNIREAA